MFCPNCRTENDDESRTCLNCGSPLPAAAWTVAPERSRPAAEVRTENVPAEIERPRDITADLLWPEETVFEMIVDTEVKDAPVDEPTPPLEADFEDAQADDFFEQSFSGLVLNPEPGPGTSVGSPGDQAEIPADEPAAPSPEVTAPAIAAPVRIDERIPDPAGDTTTFDDLAAPDQEDFQSSSSVPVEPELPVYTQQAAKSRKPRILRFAVMSLVVLAAFAAGAASGYLFLEPVTVYVPATPAPPVQESKQPVPPAGMAYVPGGDFAMGSDTGDLFSQPAHLVSVRPFYIDLTEVTNEKYAEFVKAVGYDPPASWQDGKFPEGQGLFPVTGVTWYDAAAFAAWAGKRLPTEAEWEFAARGTDGRIYPWGNEWVPALANADTIATGVRIVGGGGRSPFGLYDMSGNAWEWTASDAKPYPAGKPFPKSKLRLKIIRGGNWQSDSGKASAVFRGFYGAAGEREYNGTSFRCVKDIPKD